MAPSLDSALGLLAALYFIGAVWFVLGTRRRHRTSAQAPFATVVVAARDEARQIAGCLRSLQAQDYPRDLYEIIVVDDGSTDGTDRIIGEFEGGSVSLRMLRTEGGGSKKAALSKGIEAAAGDVILTTDADCQVGSGWIRGMVAHFTPGVGMVIGFSQIGSPADIDAMRKGYEAVDFTSLMTCIWGSAGWGRPMAASGQNLAYLKRAFTAVGGYGRVMHRASGDDVLLMQMIRGSREWSIAFADQPQTFVRHPVASSWGAFLSMRSRWASNAPTLARMDPLFFAYMAVAYVLSGLVLAVPLLWWVGVLDLWVAVAAIAGKWGAEWLVFKRGVALSGRRELRRFFPFWALLQPLHVLVAGTLGGLGLFRWKGRNHRWGRRVSEQGAALEVSSHR